MMTPVAKKKRVWVERVCLLFLGILLGMFYTSSHQQRPPSPLVQSRIPPPPIVQPRIQQPPIAALTTTHISNEHALLAIQRLGNRIKDIRSWEDVDFQLCPLQNFGSGFGMHKLCNQFSMEERCLVLSYGIAMDYSFDVDVQLKTKCHVIGLDPTVTLPSKVADHVYFVQFAAPSRDTDTSWISVSPMALASALQFPTVKILKMDCEGCEFSIYQSLLESQQMDFFQGVEQFALEVHLSRFWMKTDQDVVEYGKLLLVLEQSGLELMHAYITPCAPEHESYGCWPSLVQLGYPCETGKMCQNFLFARKQR